MLPTTNFKLKNDTIKEENCRDKIGETLKTRGIFAWRIFYLTMKNVETF